ncbi:GAF domain-containing protein [Xanthobacter sp. KR7-225]|uniref:GAF domain-containing protein n=1 Tax=Xanthobacter sp. KR7-225 TaxID=3156613 RepID=UPI0032B5C493
MDNHTDALIGIGRLAREASFADGPEAALWVVTRALPSFFLERNDGAQPATACTAFILTPDRRFHLITAPVNFASDQHHEKVALELGHPGHVAATQQPLILANTGHHTSFVKILQTFRAGSAMFAPLMWGNAYLGCMICASAAQNTFRERDLIVHQAYASLASTLWLAHGGPAWLAALDLDMLPERSAPS